MKKRVLSVVAVGVFAAGIFFVSASGIGSKQAGSANEAGKVSEDEYIAGEMSSENGGGESAERDDAAVKDADSDEQATDKDAAGENQVADNAGAETGNSGASQGTAAGTAGGAGNVQQGEKEDSQPDDTESVQPDEEVDTSLGSDLAYVESIVTDSGVEIPVLNKFNEAGLDPDCAEGDADGDMDWFGYAGDEDAPGYANVEACATAMNDLTAALGIDGGFLPQQEHISFSFTDQYASLGDLELRRDFESGYYTIGINYDMSDSEQLYSVEAGKEVLTLLCSIVSSTPAELAEFLYNESFVNEECLTSETTWVTVGDCQVQWGGYNGNELDMLVYRVRPR